MLKNLYLAIEQKLMAVTNEQQAMRVKELEWVRKEEAKANKL